MQEKVNILGVPIAAVNLPQVAVQIEAWIQKRQQSFVTVTNVHGIIESQNDGELMDSYRIADMCTPDGMPTVWLGKLHGYKNMSRVYGPDLMIEMMRRSVEKGYTHFLYGGKKGIPELLRDKLTTKFPGLRIVGCFSPPFRPMREDEENDFHDIIEEASPDILWVGLGAPKQEKWMATHLRKLNTRVMIGVGAAFDFHAGVLKQAPRWMQRSGLEWFFRLCAEPRRLWRRYLFTNCKFLWLIALQLLGVEYSRKEI